MFSNCYKYNPPDHEVVAMARKLQVRLWGSSGCGILQRSRLAGVLGGPGHYGPWQILSLALV